MYLELVAFAEAVTNDPAFSDETRAAAADLRTAAAADVDALRAQAAAIEYL